jgi:hypothetical protein
MVKSSAPKYAGSQALLPFRRPRSRRKPASGLEMPTATATFQHCSNGATPLYNNRQTNFLHPLLHKGTRAQTLNRSRTFGATPPLFWNDATAHIELSDARRCQNFLTQAIANGSKVSETIPRITVQEAAAENCPPETRRGMMQVHLSDTRSMPTAPLKEDHFSVRNGELFFESKTLKTPINLSKKPSLSDLTTVLETLNQTPFVSNVKIRQDHRDGTFVKTIYYTYRGLELVPFASSTKSWRLIDDEKDVPDYLDFVLMHPDGHEFNKLVFIASGTYDADAFANFVTTGEIPKTNASNATWGLKLEYNGFDQPYNPADRHARERDYLAYMVLTPE